MAVTQHVFLKSAQSHILEGSAAEIYAVRRMILLLLLFTAVQTIHAIEISRWANEGSAFALGLSSCSAFGSFDMQALKIQVKLLCIFSNNL